MTRRIRSASSFSETAKAESLLRDTLKSLIAKLRITALDGGATHDVDFPEAAYGVFAGGNPQYDATTLRFSYSSLVTPSTVFDYDMDSRRRTQLKQAPVLGGYDPAKYVVERLYATAHDGTRIPISLVPKKDGFRRDGSSKLLLYAYGSYGATTEPTFSSQRFSLTDRNISFAIAHVRGGQEMGRPWYDAGKMLQKMNTFTDFIDVADFLVKEKYTSPERLAANGGSAGGLLMGVVVNLRPAARTQPPPPSRGP